jgi:hypothetical protein
VIKSMLGRIMDVVDRDTPGCDPDKSTIVGG